MRIVLLLIILLGGIAYARTNCPVDLRSELPFKLRSNSGVEQWSKHEFKLAEVNLEAIAIITSASVHFQPACQKQSGAESLDQERHLSIWIRNEIGWKLISESRETLIPWDHVGEFTTALRWNERTLVVEESGYATRLAMKYTTRIRATEDRHIWQVIGQDSAELYNEYRVSTTEAQNDFDQKAGRSTTISPYSGYKNSINWLTGQASVECHNFGEIPKKRLIRFNKDTTMRFGSTSSTKQTEEIHNQMQCRAR
jgi:hypothetical protein